MLEKLLVQYCKSVRFVVWAIGRSVSFLLPVLAFIVAYEVFARYFLGAPTIWAYDTSLFLFGYISALGGAYAQQMKAHINVDILFLHISVKVRRFFKTITILLAVAFLMVMTKVSFEKFLETVEYGYKLQSEWAPNVHHFWLMICVAGVLFIAEYTTQLICHLFWLVTNRELMHTVSEQERYIAQPQSDSTEESISNQKDVIEAPVGGKHGN